MDKVFEAIRREREYQDRKWGTIKENPHSFLRWIDIVRKKAKEADEDARCWDSNHSIAKVKLLQSAAVIVACLEQVGVVERKCKHEWIMSGVEHDYYYSWRIILVHCLKCNAIGHIKNPSTHEYREAEESNRLKWREPDRVIIQGDKS